VVYVNGSKKEHFEHKKEVLKRRPLVTVVITPVQMFYLYKWISSLLKKAFRKVYRTISVLHGTAVSKNWTVQEGNIAV